MLRIIKGRNSSFLTFPHPEIIQNTYNANEVFACDVLLARSEPTVCRLLTHACNHSLSVQGEISHALNG
jgi:hypothetical protein